MESPTLERILKSPRLPSLPAVAVQIIDLVQQPDIGLNELAAAVGRDPAMAGKILKTANSSFYAQARTISRVSDALMVLGLRKVKTLALGFSLVDDLRKGGKGGGFDQEAYWQRSLLAAAAARVIATQAGRADPEEAFLGGLMHGLGVLAMNHSLGEEYQAVYDSAHGDFLRLRRAEQERFGIDHAVVGGALAERWNLPAQLTAALRYHPAPEQAPAALARIVRCVAAAAQAADVLSGPEPARALAAYREMCLDWFGIEPDEAEELMERIYADAAVVSALMDLPRPNLSVGEILSLANEALEDIQMDTEADFERLERERTALAAEVSTDQLTRIANRRRLDAFLEEQFHNASGGRAAMSVLMVDIDFFKKINDTYGHQVGDEVLRAVAGALRDNVRDRDLAARYGGEEFTVVLPDTGLAGALVQARRLRAIIEATPVPQPGGPDLSVTASIGVATLDPKAHTMVAQLLQDADAALYAAKRDGRNTVRAFGLLKAA